MLTTTNQHFNEGTFHIKHRPRVDIQEIRMIDDPWQEIMSGKDEMIRKLLSFLDHSPSPYHAVSNLSKRLVDSGFQRLEEGQSWNESVKAGGKYYFTRNGSAMVAFTIGGKYVSMSLWL